MAEEKKSYETRSIKRLEATKTASAYQKEWFKSLKPRVEAGEPFALVGADAPMEILRAMDIPFVVYQWWTAIFDSAAADARAAAEANGNLDAVNAVLKAAADYTGYALD